MSNKRRLVITSSAVLVSAALAASSWAAALPSAPDAFTGGVGNRTTEELILALASDPDVIGTAPSVDDPATIEHVLLLLLRAEQAARARGDAYPPEAADAAVQLAQTLNTYLQERGTGQYTVGVPDVAAAAARLAALLDPLGTAMLPGTAVSGEAPLTKVLMSLVEQYGSSTDGLKNGQLPDNALCAIPFATGHRLRCDAAAALILMNADYEAHFGKAIGITDSYRTLESQVRLSITKPKLAARPGTSFHGWGLALDLAKPISTGTSAEYYWLRENGPRFGWDNPEWARLSGSKPEPWHFEFFAGGNGGKVSDSAVDVQKYQDALASTSGGTLQRKVAEELAELGPAEALAKLANVEAPQVKGGSGFATKLADGSGEPVGDPSGYAPNLPTDPNDTAIALGPNAIITSIVGAQGKAPATATPAAKRPVASPVASAPQSKPQRPSAPTPTAPTLVDEPVSKPAAKPVAPKPAVPVAPVPSEPGISAPSAPVNTVPNVPVAPNRPVAPGPVACLDLVLDRTVAANSRPESIECIDTLGTVAANRKGATVEFLTYLAAEAGLPICTSNVVGTCVVDLVWEPVNGTERWVAKTATTEPLPEVGASAAPEQSAAKPNPAPVAPPVTASPEASGNETGIVSLTDPDPDPEPDEQPDTPQIEPDPEPVN